MAEADQRGVYEITWREKPLGFSIVMDTSGKNAYVSSIQRAPNVQKGLKLAAQIIKVNGVGVKDMMHSDILTKIKQAKLPMTLTFQPRSFANESDNEDKNKNVPRRLEFKNAPDDCNHVNGEFELLIKPINGRAAWQRKDDEKDPILLWFWPKIDPENAQLLKRDLWMIGRRSRLNNQDAYACLDSSAEVPTAKDAVWKCYEKAKKSWKNTKLTIMQHSI